ncbi:MAG: pseudouridine synthase [Patescibacteria group bacterium]
MEKTKYPMRINKYLAFKKYSTRRGGDELVSLGSVFINGKKAKLGDRVYEDDVVDVRQGSNLKSYHYFAYHKPKGIITHSPQEGEIDIKSSISLDDVFPVGRLDKNSHGLIILTNDGRVTDRMLNPKYAHEKEYAVMTTTRLFSNFKSKMESGVNIEGYITKKCRVFITGENKFNITLTEGKKHQIRRMCSALKYDVIDLKRVRIMNIRLGNLPVGQYRAIEGEELKEFLNKLEL